MPTDVQSTGNAYGQKKLLRTVNGVRYYSDGTTAQAPRDSGVANNGTPAYTPPKTAAAAPAAAPASSTAALVDPGYQQALLGFGQTRDNTIAQAAGAAQRELGDYGYTASYDQGGNVTGLTVDPNNPLSRAALLQKTYQQTKTGNTNSLAARGQLYSGALQNAQNNADFGYQASKNTLENQLLSDLAGYQAESAAAIPTYNVNAGQAFDTSIGNAANGNNPLYAPSVSAPAASTAPSSLTPRKVAKTVNGVNYYRTASGILAVIPKGAKIIK